MGSWLKGAGIYALTAICLADLVRAQDELHFKVIVNSANPVSSLGRRAIRRYFTAGYRGEWDGGEGFHHVPVAAIDQHLQSEVRKAFSRAVFGRSAHAVVRMCQQIIFAGKGTCPQVVDSDVQVLDYVKSTPGGIGYVSPDTSVDEVGVKEVTVER